MTRKILTLLLVGLVAGLLLLGLARRDQPASVAAPTTTPALAVVATATPLPPSATTPPPTATPLPPTPTAPPRATVAPPRPAAPAEPTPAPALETTLDNVAAAVLPARDLYEIAVRFGTIPDTAPRIVSESDPGYTLGTERVFNVSNIATQERFTVTATLRAQTDHASWWVANDVTVDQADLEASAQVFETQTYPTNRALFGSEWTPGIDGDPRVQIFLGEVPGVGGYFSSADEFPRSVNPNSNEMEIFYLNVDNAQPGESYFDGVLAHEFQHMIHWHTDRNEELWINEGLSELAGKLNGFDVGSGPDAFARDPDIPVTRWADQTHPFYGSAFLFLNYIYQRFGQAAISALVQEPADGALGFDAVLAPYGVTFDEVYADWVVANLLDDPSLADGRYGYGDGATRTVSVTRTESDFPVAARETVNQYGSDYVRFDADAGDGPLTIEFAGETTVPLLPTEAHSGAWMLWSNRGDDADASAVRPFDLSGLDRATLRFWTWYDIEPDYDYAYVAVSTDGGERWQIVPATDSVTTNPHGNSFGPGFTGRSGVSPDAPEESEAEWVEQVVDLSPFAGQSVLVGFFMVTDDALNHPGFAVDDVAIPELDYEETFEAGLGGWEPLGFVRVDNLLPQRFIVQAVIEGRDGVTVQRLPLDDANQATIDVEAFGGDVGRVTLVVTGATGYSSQPASYRYAARVD